ADGLLRLIDALEHVAADAPPVVLLIAGWIGYGPVRRAAQRGVRDRVRFVGHTADRDGLWSAVDGCATTVDHYHPAAEAFEALAAGVPVLVGREAPAAALVQSRGVGAGVVLDPGLTPPRLAEAIARLDAHRSARDRRARAAAVADDIAAAYDAVDLDALLSEPQVTKDEHGQKGWPRMNADERE
ncbi:MAG: glycosyltransferase, partial [Phycisphaeraceae bacterium]